MRKRSLSRLAPERSGQEGFFLYFWQQPRNLLSHFESVDYFGYADSLVRARTSCAYEFALEKINLQGGRILDYGSGYGHGCLRILMENPTFLVTTARFQRPLIKQRENLSRLGNIAFVRVIDYLPFSKQQFDVVFLHHVIEHIDPNMVSAFVGNLKEILKPGGILSVATPNAYEVVKPVDQSHDYTGNDLDEFLSKEFSIREAYSLIPNSHALSVHRKKQFMAKIPGTAEVRKHVSGDLWEFLYGSGFRKVTTNDFTYKEGYDEKAIDFLVFCQN